MLKLSYLLSPTGGSLVYVPAISIVSNDFTTKRALALGLAATGSAVGGVILPIMFRRLLPSIGFAWVNRALGFLILLLAILSFFLLTGFQLPSRQRGREQRPMPSRTLHHGQRIAPIPSPTPRKRLKSAFASRNDRGFLFLCIGNFFVFLGYWVPLFYVVPFATIYLGTSSTYANYLLAILNAGSFLGRVVPAWVSQVIGTANILFIGATTLGTLVFVWLRIGNVAGITIWSFLVGYDSLSDSQQSKIQLL